MFQIYSVSIANYITSIKYNNGTQIIEILVVESWQRNKANWESCLKILDVHVHVELNRL